jgi:hypothetical protein
VVANLIGRLEFGELPERPSYHALGALLDAVLELSDVPTDSKQFIAGLVVRYSLVGDPIYIGNLRSQYHLDEVAQRAPTPEQVVSFPEKGAAVTQPSFTATIPDEQVLETVINSEDNFLDINHLYRGYLLFAGSVLDQFRRKTGWHWLPGEQGPYINQSACFEEYRICPQGGRRFGYMLDAYGSRAAGRVIKLNP